MVMKKIIAFIICLALCVSGLAVGVMNRQAKDVSGVPGTALNAVTVPDVGGSDVALGNIAVGFDGSKVGASSLPTEADPNNDNGTLSGPKDGVYTLTGNVVIEDAEDEVYKALVKAFEIKRVETTEGDTTVASYTPSETHYTLDGKGYTITTVIPLFDVIGNCTIKNLVIAGNVSVKNNDLRIVPAITAGAATKDTYNSCGIITTFATGKVNFENVSITAKITYTGSFKIGAALAPFIATTNVNNNVTGATVTLKNCAFSGSISSDSENRESAIEVKASGLLGNLVYGTFIVKNCTVSGTICSSGHCGGFFNEGGSSIIKITDSEFTGNISKPSNNDSNGFMGGICGTGSGVNATVENCNIAGTIKLTSTAEAHAGSVAGFADSGSMYITNSKVTTNISTNGSLNFNAHVGGVVGQYGGAELKIEGSEIDATINVRRPNIAGNQNKGIAGVVGNAASSGKITVSGCALKSDITVYNEASGSGDTLSGVIGYVSAGVNITINNGTTLEGTLTKKGGNVCGGVIARTNKATVGDFKIDGMDILPGFTFDLTGANSMVGGLFGYMNKGFKSLSVENFNFAGTIKGNTGEYDAVLAAYIGTAVTDGISFKNVVLGVPDKNGNIQGSFSITPTITKKDARFGGFIGYIDVGTCPSIKFQNCVNNIDITVILDNRSCGCIGGFIGRIQGCTPDVEFIDCVNNGDAIIDNYSNATKDEGSLWNTVAGGFIGLIVTDCPVTVTNSVNNGNVGAYHHNVGKEIVATFAGGFAGDIMGSSKSVSVTSFVNNGDVSAASRTSQPRAAGLIGWNSRTNVSVNKFVNTGDITASAWGGNGHAYNKNNYVLGGETSGTAGTVAATADGAYAAGIINNSAANVSFNYCVNLGDVASTHKAAAFIYSTALVNAGTSVKNAVNTGNAPALILTDKTAEDITTTEFTSVYNLGTVANPIVASDGNVAATGITTNVNFSATAGEANGSDVIFNTTIDKAFYDIIETAAGDKNVEFEAIVTLDKYVTKVGALTHKALDDFYKANAAALAAKGVSKLYMDAEREEANIVADDAKADNAYGVKIVLKNATPNVDYTARAFIKIGNAYIYSTVDAE